MMRMSPKGVALLKSFESCRLTAYPDHYVAGLWSIGWGHTGSEIREGLVWTQAQADAQLSIDIRERGELPVTRSVDVALTQNQFDALVDFTYNVGAGNEAHSTLIRLVNARDFAGAAAEFPKWHFSAGNPSEGLARRREAERELFLAA